MRFACLIALACLPALGQRSAATATIQGSVSDPSGAAVAGAHVAARNVDSGTTRITDTDASGRFNIPGVRIGNWTLRVEHPGFGTTETDPFSVSVGQAVVRQVQLSPAGVTEKLEVKGSEDAVETTASTASVALGYERIEEAPARSRNYLNFVLAAPGVAPSAGSASQRTMTGVRSPLADAGFTFGGMRPRNNSIQIDGMDNRDETTGGNRVAVGLEMVQEFRVSATSVGAELGGAAGGVLNMVTRSGVNLWHGDVTFFGQNEALNARRGEVDAGPRPRFRRQQPGASALGPLQRDKTFIAAAVEYEREFADEFSNVPGGVPGTYRGLYPTGTRGIEASTKLDHQFSATEMVSVRYAASKGKVLGEVQGPDNFADRSSQGNSLTTDHSLVGSWLRVMSPAVVNKVRAQYAQRVMRLWPNGSGPMLEIPGVATLGQYFRMNSERTERHYEVSENFHFSANSHRLTVGVDVHAVTLNAALRDRFAGIFVFPTLDDYLQGRPDVFIQAFGDPHTHMRTFPIGMWLQDRWELRPGLLLELGLRYDRQVMPAGLPSSSNNAAPRIGLAWRPSQTRPLVFRAGAGLFYDRYPLAFLNEAVQKNGVQAFEQYAAGADAVRAFTSPRAGAVLGVAQRSYSASADFPSTYSRKLSAGVEYGVGADSTVTVEGSWIRGLHLPRIREWLLEQTANSSYSGVSMTWNRRYSKELAWLISYTWAQTRDDGSDFDERPMNPLDVRADRGWSRQDQRHRFAASALFDLPGEISVAPIVTLGSGRAINALLTTDVYRTGAYPLSARPPGFARNPFRSEGSANLDMRVMKTIPLQERRSILQFGVESFNLLNHTNPERVSQYYAAGNTPLPSYGQIIESLPARQVQLLVQLEF